VTESHPTRFFVVHLQKTAGTSLRDRFRATFDPEAIYPNASDGPVGHSVVSVSHLLDRWAQRRSQLRVIAGHFPLSTVELLGADFVTLSVLRHPVDRTLSYLRHQRQLNVADRAGTLEDVYADPFRYHGLIRNHMTRMFAITAEEMRPGDGVLTNIADSPTLVERAKEGLVSLDSFGLQPRFDEFWDDFSRNHSLVRGAPLRSNQTEACVDVPPTLIERILEDNALDVELYDFAAALYDERARRRPPL
jgi:hypothetical protein